MDIVEGIENEIVVSLFNVLRSQTILNLNKSHKQERVQKTAPFPVERTADREKSAKHLHFPNYGSIIRSPHFICSILSKRRR